MAVDFANSDVIFNLDTIDKTFKEGPRILGLFKHKKCKLKKSYEINSSKEIFAPLSFSEESEEKLSDVKRRKAAPLPIPEPPRQSRNHQLTLLTKNITVKFLERLLQETHWDSVPLCKAIRKTNRLLSQVISRDAFNKEDPASRAKILLYQQLKFQRDHLTSEDFKTYKGYVDEILNSLDDLKPLLKNTGV